MAANVQKIRDKIEQAVQASDDVKEGNYVTVKAEKSGLFGKGHIVLSGRTRSEAVKNKVQEIAESVAEGIEIKNELRVSTTA